MQSKNRLIVASAGSGKTTYIVDSAVADSRKGLSVLITTFTEACEAEIRESIIATCRAIPKEITVQTWFSFLISHGVKPFQGTLFQHDVKGMVLVNGRSGLRYKNKEGKPIYFGEDDFNSYFFSPEKNIYSDKLALLALRCDDVARGRVFHRISRCFAKVYVDEVQDLAGYDLEIIDRLLASSSDTLLVGDPRQATYSTHNSRKHRKYRKANIVNFFKDRDLDIEIDDQSLVVNYRCCASICEFANQIYPEMVAAKAGRADSEKHDGVFAVPEYLVNKYLEEYRPVQLRENVLRRVNEDYQIMNFGKSKGLSFDRVLIYPSISMVDWLKSGKEMGQAPKAKLYVATTRARRSVGIVLKAKDIDKIKSIPTYRKGRRKQKPSQDRKSSNDFRWTYIRQPTGHKYQAIAQLERVSGATIRLYGCIEKDPKDAISRTKNFFANALRKLKR